MVFALAPGMCIVFNVEKLMLLGFLNHSARSTEKWISGVTVAETIAKAPTGKVGDTVFKTLFTPEKPPQ